MSRRRFIFFFVLTATGLAVLGTWDLVWFLRTVRGYTLAAIQGIDIQAPKIEGEVIVVLTGDQRRIPKGIELLRARGGALLVISGTGKSTSLKDLVNQQGDAAVNIHEVWEKIIIESQSSSTIENAIETGKILSDRGARRVILVTSDYHMYRSLLIFKQGLPGYEYVPYPVVSGLVEFAPLPSQIALIACWRTWLEYWKLLLLRLGLVSIPIPK